MGALSPVHLIIILVVALLVIGPGKLPETGAALGRAIRDFRQAVDGTPGAATPGRNRSRRLDGDDGGGHPLRARGTGAGHARHRLSAAILGGPATPRQAAARSTPHRPTADRDPRLMPPSP